MDHGKAVIKIFENIPEGSRRGRFTLRWLEDVQLDLREMEIKEMATAGSLQGRIGVRN
jgi:hypothetical protein